MSPKLKSYQNALLFPQKCPFVLVLFPLKFQSPGWCALALKNLWTFPADRGVGFYNVSLGTILDSRYKVVRKLGWGQHANVWLAVDVQYDSITCSFFHEDLKMTPYFGSGFFAIKILTTYATRAQSRMAEELGILRHIRRGYHQIIRDMVTLRERERALNLRVHVVVISVPSSGACWELSSNMVKKKITSSGCETCVEAIA